MIKVNDKVVVQGIMPPAVVSNVWFEAKTARTVIELDWGSRGTSKVYAHDENHIWYKYNESN